MRCDSDTFVLEEFCKRCGEPVEECTCDDDDLFDEEAEERRSRGQDDRWRLGRIGGI